MIRKSEIIDAINSINHDLLILAANLNDLSTEVDDIKMKVDKVSKSKKAEKQARDKSGKFVKK